MTYDLDDLYRGNYPDFKKPLNVYSLLFVGFTKVNRVRKTDLLGFLRNLRIPVKRGDTSKLWDTSVSPQGLKPVRECIYTTSDCRLM